jgi:adenylate cyclase
VVRKVIEEMMNKKTSWVEFLIRKKWIRGALVGIGAFLIVLVLQNWQLLTPLEWKSWDLRLRLFSDSSRVKKDIVLFFVDQYSLDLYEKHQGFSWPWPRQMYSAVLQYCQAGGVKACIFDLILTEGSVYGVEDDDNFSKSMDRAGNVFLTLFLSQEESEFEEVSLPMLDHLFSVQPSQNKAVFPAKSAALPLENLLHSARGVGNVQFSPDEDGIYRRLPLLFSYRNLLIPSLPIAAAEFFEGEKVELEGIRGVYFKGKKISLDDSGQMIIRYHGPTGTYPSYSIAAIINSWAQMEEGKSPQIPPREFREKIVLVSASAPGLLDLRPTPLSSVCPGAEILATVIDNLTEGDFISPPKKGLSLLVLVVFSLITGLGVSYFQSLWKIILFSLLCLALPLVGSWLAFFSSYWLEHVPPEFAVLISFTGASLLNFSVEGRQRRFIKSVFRFYLSSQVIDQILKDPELLHLGGEKREVSSFFSDIAGFTALSEDLSPEELVNLLNAYLSEMTDIILSYQGTLDKYEGDAIIAFWNAPLDQPDHASRACRTALECQQQLTELRPKIQSRFGQDLFMRIGINSGPVVVGNMGSSSRFDYTAIGDTVNIASRLEGACKQYDVPILVGERTYEMVEEHIIAREIDTIRVLGKKKAIRAFEVLGEKEQMSDAEMERISRFNRALEAYKNRNWAKAGRLFQKLKDDRVAQIYIKRCQRFRQSPPPEDWDGVYGLRSK